MTETQKRFPVIIFVHGTASFRTQALNQMTHWASRGFIVLSADHPRIRLKDILGPLGTIGAVFANQKRDVENILKALADLPEELQFLEDRIDLNNIGLTGHSAGGGAVGGLSSYPGVKIVMPMAGRGVEESSSLENVLFFGAERDGVGSYDGHKSGYTNYEGRADFVGLLNAGHLAFLKIAPWEPKTVAFSRLLLAMA